MKSLGRICDESKNSIRFYEMTELWQFGIAAGILR